MSATVSLPELKQIIVDSLNLEGVDPQEIGDEQALFGEGLGLDSVDALELVVALEKRLGVRIRSEEVDPSVFSSPASIHRFIEARAAAAEGRSG